MKQPFAIIGGQRCSTGWLSMCVGEHPEIFVAGDELRLFERNYQTNLDWESIITQHLAYDGQPVFGEKTANYLTDPEVAQRMHSHVPNMKVIAILRDPVLRILSQFRMTNPGAKKQTLQVMRSESDFWADAIARCRYSTHLNRYLTLFPKEQVKVLIYEDRKDNAPGMLRDTFEFLGVDPAFQPDSTFIRTKPSSIENAGRMKKFFSRLSLHPKSPLRDWYTKLFPVPEHDVDPELILACVDMFASEVRALEKELKRDLSHWLCHRDQEKIDG